jgi:signal transduction histidine kinase
MTQRIKRLLRAQQDFVADASHQLRTPLTGLRLRLEGLADRFRGEAPVERELGAAMAEIDRLSLIVDELLILSRAGEHELPGERIDLRETVRRAAERWRATAADRGIEIVQVDGGSSAEGWCAAPDLERSLDSLIENALTYSPAGATVRLEATPGRIVVLDDGPGLAPGEEEVVFERFSRGSAGKQGTKGTGLGLAIARELTRQWGGEVRLRNRSGGGLVATIELSPAEVRA